MLLYPSKIIAAASIYLATELICQAADYVTLHADSDALSQRAAAILSKVRRPIHHSKAEVGEFDEEVQTALNLELPALEGEIMESMSRARQCADMPDFALCRRSALDSGQLLRLGDDDQIHLWQHVLNLSAVSLRSSPLFLGF